MSSWCLSPGYRHTVKGRNQPYPCGKCCNCKKRRTSGWSFRIMQQSKVASSSMFVTLTYDTANVPITKKGYMALNKEHVQLYFKRLRKSSPGVKIVYYLCGEYGGRSYRPHYHVILFNALEKDVTRCWTYGSVHVGTVTVKSVGYTLKYISKPGKVPMHINDDRPREFQLMSKGIGKNI